MTLNAVLCEGAAEQAIMTVLIEQNVLTIEQNTLFYGKIFRDRIAKRFFERYMRSQMDEEVTIYRIVDSKKEKFKISSKIKKEFSGKYRVVDVITSPEIEILIIVAEGKYNEFIKMKSKMKPSEYCKSKLNLKNVKDYEYVKDYFKDVNKLIDAINKYHSLMKNNKEKDTQTLYDLLENKYKR